MKIYVNKLFGECTQNFTINHFNLFQSCGNLMSDKIAIVGLLFIFVGLSLLTFVILPLLVKLKKSKDGGLR